jgi:hypothetical protein
MRSTARGRGYARAGARVRDRSLSRASAGVLVPSPPRPQRGPPAKRIRQDIYNPSGKSLRFFFCEVHKPLKHAYPSFGWQRVIYPSFFQNCPQQKHVIIKISVVDPKLFCADPDSDTIFVRVLDPDSDPDSDPDPL